MAKEKKGLGTGLGVLFGEDDFSEAESELMTLPISKVEPRKEQPREYFDEAALQDLADSIEQFGLIQPIVARKPHGRSEGSTRARDRGRRQTHGGAGSGRKFAEGRSESDRGGQGL